MNLLTRQQAAEFLGISLRTLDALSTDPAGPPYKRLSARIIRFDQSELTAWVQSRTQNKTTFKETF